MKKNNYEEFIKVYKELENSLMVEKSLTIFDWEQAIDEEEQKKLRIVRLARNYIQHNADYEDFIAINAGMIKFVNEQIIRIKADNGLVKDFKQSMAGYGSICSSDCLATAATKLSAKNGKVAVLDGAGVAGFLTDSIFVSIIGSGAKLSEKVIKHLGALDTKYETVLADTPMADIRNEAGLYVVVNAANTPVGVYEVKING